MQVDKVQQVQQVEKAEQVPHPTDVLTRAFIKATCSPHCWPGQKMNVTASVSGLVAGPTYTILFIMQASANSVSDQKNQSLIQNFFTLRICSSFDLTCGVLCVTTLCM